MRKGERSRFLVRPPVRLFLFLYAVAPASCNGSCNGQGGGPNIVTNAMSIEVMNAGFNHQPSNVLYTTVKICNAQSNCQTVDKIQLDTGSSGLRVFKQVLTIGLSPVMSGQATVAECQSFAIGTTWGPVETASVVMAAEPPVTVPIQVIDSTFGSPATCSGTPASPDDMGANGILGVDVRATDEGDYYTCQNTTCTHFMAPATQQVANPVRALPADNNGVIVNLAAIPDTGQPSISGQLILGIGTSWDNDPKTYSNQPIQTVTLNPADPIFTTATAANLPFSEFAVDSGSNKYFFTTPNIPQCIVFGLQVDSYCPLNPCNFGVQVSGTNGSQWHFQGWILNEKGLAATNNTAFNDDGAAFVDPSMFIAGMPFFYGKIVYFGYTNTTSSLGSGPLYAYSMK